MKRPMLYWVISFVLGEVLTGMVPGTGMVVICIIIFTVIWRGRQAYIERNRRLLCFGVLFFLFGFICTAFWNRKAELCDFKEGELVDFRGRVVERIDKNDKYTYKIKSTIIGGKRICAGLLMESGEVITLGSVIAGEGEYRDFSIAANPGQFDERSYQLSKGNYFRLINVRINDFHLPVIGIRQVLWNLRKEASEVLERYMKERSYSIARAMLLGEKADMDQEIKELYQRNGIAHLLAISGLHVAMLGGTLYHLLRRVSGSFGFAAFSGGIFIIMYGMMTGLSGATIRAVIMLVLTIGSDVLGRKYDAVTGLSIALIIMLINNPMQVGQAGFLLSFGAVMGITCVYPVLKEKIEVVCGKKVLDSGEKERIARSIPGKVMNGFLVSLSVQLVTTPILLYFFYEIPLYSVFLNIIAVPLMSILLGGLIAVEIAGALEAFLMFHGIDVFIVPGKFFGMAAKGAGKISDSILELYELLCKVSEQLPHHSICTGRPGTIWIVFYYAILAGTIMYFKFSKGKALMRSTVTPVILAVSAMCILWSVLFLHGKTEICMFDVGQGDGIYIKTPGRSSILIDGGSSSKKKVGSYILKNGIKYYGGSHLDYSIVTHADSDHYSGVLELFDFPDIEIDNFVLPYITNPDEAYIELCQKAYDKGCNIIYLKSGDKLVVGDVTFICLNPEKREYRDKNSGSLVLWMRYGSFDMLFTGDMDSSVENSIVNNPLIRESVVYGNSLEVLKVAHHGSNTASSEGFLKSFGFDTALVSVGERNSYGHPAKDVMERLQKYCKYIYLTKESGAITIETDGMKYRIREFLPGYMER